MTSPISTICAISSTAAWSSRRSSSRSVFGILGGIGTHPEDVMHMKRTADRLFGDNYQLVGAGRRPQPDARSPPSAPPWAAMCASASRIRFGPAPASSPSPTPSRSRIVRQIIEGLGLEVATPDEAREILRAQGRRQGGVLDGRCSGSKSSAIRKRQLGEGPLWDVTEERLYWIDSLGPAVHSCDLNGDNRRTWPLPEPIGSLAFREKGRRGACAANPASISSISPRAR